MNDYLNRVNRPVQVVNRGDGSGQTSPAGGGKKMKLNGDSFKIFSALLLGLITVLLIALVVYLVVFKDNSGDLAAVKTNQYQAVFLNSNDGQVYFGKLSQWNEDYYKLSDIYYVRVTNVQPDDGTKTAQQNISLAKLGNEIHGPEDAMYVAKDNVMFWENLKEDGQVVKAIREYQKNGAQPTVTPTATPVPTTTKTP